MRPYLGPEITPPVEQQLRPAHGFFGRLGQHAVGALRGLGAGLESGNLGEALGGAIAGGVRPQSGVDLDYRNRVLPQWQQQTAAAQDLAGKRLGLAGQIAGLTGVNPVTGQPTFGAQTAQEKQDLADQLADIRASHEKTIQEMQQQREEDMQAYRQGRINDEQFRLKEEARHNQEMESSRQQMLELRSALGMPETVTRTTMEQADPGMAAWQNGYNAYSDYVTRDRSQGGLGYPVGSSEYKAAMGAWKQKYPPPPGKKVETETRTRGNSSSGKTAASLRMVHGGDWNALSDKQRQHALAAYQQVRGQQGARDEFKSQWGIDPETLIK